MSFERLPKFVKESSSLLVPLGLLAISLCSVSFNKRDEGKIIKRENDFTDLSDPEIRVARKLLQLGINPRFESIQIKLDEPVEVAGKNKRTGKSKTKSITTPDFYFKLNGVECYLEIGSHGANAHKRRQKRVMERVVKLKENKRVLYIQLFHDDIHVMEESIETKDDLLDFLYNNEMAIYSR